MDLGLRRFVALAGGTAVYATAGPAVVWWFSAIAGIAAALGVGVMAPMIAHRTATPEPLTPQKPALAASS